MPDEYVSKHVKFCSKEVSKDLRGLFSIPFLEEHPSLLTKKFNRILLRN
jgi:hypothetical protein